MEKINHLKKISIFALMSLSVFFPTKNSKAGEVCYHLSSKNNSEHHEVLISELCIDGIRPALNEFAVPVKITYRQVIDGVEQDQKITLFFRQMYRATVPEKNRDVYALFYSADIDQLEERELDELNSISPIVFDGVRYINGEHGSVAVGLKRYDYSVSPKPMTLGLL